MPKSMHSNYFEAIIQLRPAKKEVLDFVLDQIKKNDIYVSKYNELKTGVDIYISSRKFANQLLRRLKKSFKGTSKVSKALHSQDRQTGKLKYRITVLFRPE